MKKFLALVLAVATAFAPTLAFAGDAIGTLTYTEGRVDRAAEGGFDYVPVVREEEIRAGDVIRTKSHSKAEIRFGDGSLARLAENSQLRIQQYELDAQGKREKAQLFVDRGTVRAIVEKAANKQANFLIDTPNMRGAIKGSDIVVGYQRAMTNLASFEGQIQAQSVDFSDHKPIVVTPGNTGSLSSVEPPAAPRKMLDLEKKRYEAETTAEIREIKSPEELSQGVITKYEGDVRVKTKGAREWHRAALKEALGPGDQIETGANGQMTLLLESGRAVDMKPGTHVEIRELNVDLKTGARVDVLASMQGSLRARIDRVKGRESSFKVVTPTAVASVRGTILYLNVAGKNVTSYFEQGHGGLLSLIDNTEKEVKAGEYAALNNGVLEGPAIPDQDQINAFRSGWDDYGYSQGNNNFIPADFGGTDDGDSNELSLGVAQNLFDQVQNVPNTSSSTGPSPIQWAVWNDENEREQPDSLYMNDGGYAEKVGEERGVIMGFAPWDSAQTFAVTGGEFSENEFDGDAPPLLWNTTLQSRQEPAEETEIEVTDAASDGGALFGRTVGLWNDKELLGSLVAIFVGPSGNAGVIQGAVAGEFDRETGLWNAFGVTVPQAFSQLPDLDTFNFLDYKYTGYLYGRLAGEFVGEEIESGNIFADVFDATTTFLWADDARHSETWGIYAMWLGDCESWFSNLGELVEFAALVGGRASFGRYSTGEGEGYGEYDDQGYWFGVAGTSEEGWVDGVVRGFIEGVYLTRTQMGVIGGNLWGLFDSEGSYGTWLGASAGVFEGDHLEFYGDWREDSFYSNDGGSWYDTGWHEGYFGGVESPWSDGALGEAKRFLAMGEYEACEIPVLFNTKLRSDNAYTGESVTYDGSFFRGRAAGVFTDEGGVEGAAAAIWVRGNGDAGVAFGNMAGEHSEDFGLWYAEGEWTANRQALGLDIEDLNNANINNAYFSDHATDATITGEEGSAGWVDVWLDDARKYYLMAGDDAQNWGFVDVRFGGEFSLEDAPEALDIVSVGYDDLGTDDNGYWHLGVSGDWADEDGVFRGDFEGTFLSRTYLAYIEGDAYGLFDDYGESGTFIAQALGTFTGGDLALSGDWGQEYSSLYRLGGEDEDDSVLERYGEETGWIGGLASPWDAENGMAAYAAMGEYWLDGYYYSGPFVWYTPFQSYNDESGDNVSFDGGGFWGFTQGVWAGNKMAGSVAALFTDGEGRIGVVRGNADGGYSATDGPGYGLWHVRGDLEVIASETGADWVNSGNLGDGYNVRTEAMDELYVHGGFDSPQEDDNYISGEAESGGYYAFTNFFYPRNGNLVDNDLERTPLFGIFDFFLEGDGSRRPDDADAFTFAIGGEGTFGRFVGDSGVERDDLGDWFATGSGTWADDVIIGSFDGAYLTDTQYGTISGDLAGLFEEDGEGNGSEYGNWAGAGLGTFTGRQLDFAGRTNGAIFSFNENQLGLFGGGSELGMVEGRLGGFGDLWAAASQAVPVHFLGDFEGGGDGASMFVTVFTSYNAYDGTYGTFDAGDDGGAFVGFAAGRWAEEHTAAHARGFYVAPDGTLGYLSGSFTGNQQFTYEGESEEDFGMWSLDGGFMAHRMGSEDDFDGIYEEYDLDLLSEEFDTSIVIAISTGLESQPGEGDDFLFMALLAFDVKDESEDNHEWGIWLGFLGGMYENMPVGAFRQTMSGVVVDENFNLEDSVIMGTVRGTHAVVDTEGSTQVGTFDADFRGVWISEESEDGFLTAGSVAGEFAGDFSRETEGSWSETTFEAAGTGQFIGATQFVTDKTNFNFEELQNFLSVPITESHAGLLASTGGGVTGTMDASFFANQFSSTGGIWAAIFNGTFTSTPGSTWTFTDGTINATLNNVQWMTENQQWLADVTGTLPGVPEGFTGQAGGTFQNPLEDAPGVLTGVGTGTWGTGPEQGCVNCN